EAASEDLKRRFNGACRVIELAATQPTDADSLTRAHAQGAVAAFLDAVAPLADSRSQDDIGRVQNQLEQGRTLLANHGDALEEDLHQALTKALDALEATRDRLLDLNPAHASLDRLCRRVDGMTPAKVPPGQLAELERDWDRAWSALTHPNASDQSARTRFRAAVARLRSDRDAQAERRRVALERIDERLATLDAALEAGDLAASAAAQQTLLEDLDAIGHHPKTRDADFRARLTQDRRRLQELRDWQHWSNNEIRARLCEQAEAIPGSGLHPDAVAAKVKELQQRWKDLDASEKLPGDTRHRRPNQKLWRRFQSACNEAFEAARPFFEKRAEIREGQLEALEAVIAELDAAAADADRDVRDLERLLGRARGSLRKLGEIPPRQRKRMARRLRSRADALEQRLEPHYEVVERRKQRLIETVQALVETDDLDQAIQGAIEAQGQWKTAGVTRRDRENRLWKTFRKACDAVFARRDEARASERAELREQAEALDALLAETRALLER
ncbi:MAG: DUF349 domain-containing protein, partial [Kiloniellales bacterium]|nr:DUF349 domain-containing protein [Kiloniellales bacterium]